MPLNGGRNNFSSLLNLQAMSFINAGQPIFTYLGRYGNVDRNYNVIPWILSLSRSNTAIQNIRNGEMYSYGPGMLRKAHVTYWPILCDQDFDTGHVCDGGVRRQPKQVEFAITEEISTEPYEIWKDDIRLVDANILFSDNALSVLHSMMPGIRKEIATRVLTKLFLNAGCQLDGNPTAPLRMADSTNGVINPVGLWQIERDFDKGGFDNPYVLGEEDVDIWKRGTQQIGGLNASGQEIGRLPANNMAYAQGLLDGIAGDLINGSHVLAVDPRVVAFVTFSENAGKFMTNMRSIEDLNNLYWEVRDGSIFGQFLDPISGLIFDLRIKFDDCGGVNRTGAWTIQIKLKWDMWFMPDIACNDYECTNGIFHYRTCPKVIAPCPTGTAPASPADTEQFCATPDDSCFPLAINTLNVNGYETTPNVIVETIADLIEVLNDNSQIAFSASSPAGDICYTGTSAIEVGANFDEDGNPTYELTFS